MDQRGDHSMHCMWSPLWYWLKFKPSKTCFLNEKNDFFWVFRWKEIVSTVESDMFFKWKKCEFLEQDFQEWKFWHGPKGGPQYALHVVPPLVLTKIQTIQNMFFKWKKCEFFWKEIVSIRIGRFGARFSRVKILTWTKGGTTVCIACGPPFGTD